MSSPFHNDNLNNNYAQLHMQYAHFIACRDGKALGMFFFELVSMNFTSILLFIYKKNDNESSAVTVKNLLVRSYANKVRTSRPNVQAAASI